LGEICNSSMGAAATALYSILGRKVVITTPQVTVLTLQDLASDHLRPYVVVDVEYTEGFLGRSLFILQVEDVKIITDIMMGGEGVVSEEDLSELHLSAIGEAMNQMMGGMATSMADMFNRVVNISPPHTMIIELDGQEIHELIGHESPELIRISFSMEIEGLMHSSIMQLMPLRFGKQLVSGVIGDPEPAAPASSSPMPFQVVTAEPVAHDASTTPASSPVKQSSDPVWQPPVHSSETMPSAQVDARPVQLPNFDAPVSSRSDPGEFGLGLIMDVALKVSVELGQCKKTIREILDLNTGSILTLDKPAGEPVDIVVHGKPVAKGEVIVIDDNYGIRITEILTPPQHVLSGNGR
ncbi:MAG: flagellar motor switch phosphatase FliY, partial [Clostridiaceae bacterium]|nr:flagellar motor switch phosphatase FliY [Clostridiaceae bacterium]